MQIFMAYFLANASLWHLRMLPHTHAGTYTHSCLPNPKSLTIRDLYLRHLHACKNSHNSKNHKR